MSETENPKLDDMTFTDAAEYCLELRRSFMVWRGHTYNLKDDRDIQRGIARQKGVDQENARKSGDMADAMFYTFVGMDLAKQPKTATDMRPFRVAYERALARIDHLEGILSKRIISDCGSQAAGAPIAGREDPDFSEIDAPIAGRMITDKRVDLLRIERQANGGWLVDGRKDVRDDHITRSDVSAAFTNTADMLRALADLLERDDEKRKEAQDG